MLPRTKAAVDVLVCELELNSTQAVAVPVTVQLTIEEQTRDPPFYVSGSSSLSGFVFVVRPFPCPPPSCRDSPRGELAPAAGARGQQWSLPGKAARQCQLGPWGRQPPEQGWQSAPPALQPAAHSYHVSGPAPL